MKSKKGRLLHILTVSLLQCTYTFPFFEGHFHIIAVGSMHDACTFRRGRYFLYLAIALLFCHFAKYGTL